MEFDLSDSVTLKIKVTTPKQIGFLRGLWECDIPDLQLTAVKLFELSHGNGVFQQTDGRTAPLHDTPILQWAYDK